MLDNHIIIDQTGCGSFLGALAQPYAYKPELQARIAEIFNGGIPMSAQRVVLGVNERGYEFPIYDGQLLSWTLSSTLEDEQQGFPRLRCVIRAMMQYRPEQLERERYDCLRGSFDRMFGQNAKRVLNVIEEEVAR